MRSAVIGVIVVGFGLVGLSGLWSTLFPASNNWTPEKAARAAEVKSKVYAMAFTVNSQKAPSMQKGDDLGQMKAQFEELKKENAQLDAEFNSATGTPQTISKFLRWTGLSLAAVGVIGWYAVNQSR